MVSISVKFPKMPASILLIVIERVDENSIPYLLPTLVILSQSET